MLTSIKKEAATATDLEKNLTATAKTKTTLN